MRLGPGSVMWFPPTSEYASPPSQSRDGRTRTFYHRAPNAACNLLHLIPDFLLAQNFRTPGNYGEPGITFLC